MMGVNGKLQLWKSLLAVAPGEERLDTAQLERLVERAVGQRERLQVLHDAAARRAFGSSVTTG